MAMVLAGLAALRGPDGSFLPSEPIYREMPVKESGMTEQQEKNTEELAKWMVGKFEEYRKGCRKENAVSSDV